MVMVMFMLSIFLMVAVLAPRSLNLVVSLNQDEDYGVNCGNNVSGSAAS